MAQIATTVDAEITASAVMREGKFSLTVQAAVAYGKHKRRAAASASHEELSEVTRKALEDALSLATSELQERAMKRAVAAAATALGAAAQRGEE